MKYAFEFNIADVSGRNEQQRRLTGQQVRTNEITILGDDNSIIADRTGDNVGIRRTIPKRQIQGV